MLKRGLKRAWEGWKKIAAVIGRFQTRVLLTVFYFLVAGAAWLVITLLGKDLLKRRIGEDSSYWVGYESIGETAERARRQF